MNLQLEGQTAVVIGAAQGMGCAIAEAFAAEGANVALLDIAPGVETTAAETAAAYGVQTLGLQVDAADYEAVQSAALTIQSALGTCEHLVYAAGRGSGKFGFPFWNLEPEDWGRVLEINLLGVVHAAHAFAPEMAKNRRGTMLFLASIAGQIGSQTDPPYSAAKAGVINFAQCAAKDLAPYGVRVNVICPGMVQTALNRSVWQAWNARQSPENQLDYEAWGAAKVRQVAPLGQWQEPQEIAAMAVYLASPMPKTSPGKRSM